MKRQASVLLVSVALLVVNVVAHPLLPAPSSGATQAEVAQFRAALQKAVQSKDVSALKNFYRDEFTHTHTSGKVDGKDARIVSLLAGEPTVEMAPTPEYALSCYGESVCIARALSPIKRSSDGKWFDVRWTQTLVKTDKGWQIAISQATGLMNTVRDNL